MSTSAFVNEAYRTGFAPKKVEGVCDWCSARGVYESTVGMEGRVEMVGLLFILEWFVEASDTLVDADARIAWITGRWYDGWTQCSSNLLSSRQCRGCLLLNEEDALLCQASFRFCGTSATSSIRAFVFCKIYLAGYHTLCSKSAFYKNKITMIADLILEA